MSLLAKLAEEIGDDGAKLVMAKFLQDTPARLQVILTHLEAQDWQALSKEAHAICGSFGAIGADDLMQDWREVMTESLVNPKETLAVLQKALADSHDFLKQAEAELNAS